MNETQLLKELFKGYNKHTRLLGTGPVTVTFYFQLIDILDVVSFYNLYCQNKCVYNLSKRRTSRQEEPTGDLVFA